MLWIFFIYILDSTPYHHHHNINWGYIFWKNGVHGAPIQFQRLYRTYAKKLFLKFMVAHHHTKTQICHGASHTSCFSLCFFSSHSSCPPLMFVFCVGQYHGCGFCFVLLSFLMVANLILIPMQYKDPSFSSTHHQIVVWARVVDNVLGLLVLCVLFKFCSYLLLHLFNLFLCVSRNSLHSQDIHFQLPLDDHVPVTLPHCLLLSLTSPHHLPTSVVEHNIYSTCCIFVLHLGPLVTPCNRMIWLSWT